MKKNYTLLFVITLLLSKAIITNAQVNVQDSLALVSLYNSTNGPHWQNNTNWLTHKPVAKWVGVFLSNNRVQGIQLGSNQLSGNLPSSIGNLDQLTSLDLSFNQISGKIPSSIGNPGQLNTLNLSYNQLSGSIPATTGNLASLTELFLNNNKLTGIIPFQLYNLTNIVALDLSTNQLTGNIKPAIGKLIKLTTLYLYNNQLSGSIPSSIGKLAALRSLQLYANDLTGTIPSSTGDLANLQSLNLGVNQLSGAIPSTLGNLILLARLGLYNNQLSGNIPSSLGNLSQLIQLSLEDNKLSGSIPSSLGKLINLESLDLSQNKNLSGMIPASFINLKKLQSLKINYDKLTGAVPVFFDDLPKLNVLEIIFNHFNFDGIETLAQHNFQLFKYFNQKPIDLHQNNNILSVSAGGTPGNNTYEWYRNGSLVATIKGDSIFAPTGSGHYNVLVTNSIATQLTLQSDTLFYAGGGLTANNMHAQNYNANFSLYPNPAKTTATVIFNGSGNCTLRLTDISGKVLQVKTITAVEGANNIQLDVARFPAGVYFVTLSNEKGVVQILKFSKQ